LYAPTTFAASSYLHHSLTVGLQEKMAATGFEPVTKGLPIPWFAYKKVKQYLVMD